MAQNTTSIDYTGIFDGRPAPEEYKASEQEKERAKELNKRIHESKQWRQNWEWQWDFNRLYLKGDQLIGRHKISGTIVRLSREDSRKVKAQNNVVRPVARSLIGKLSKMIPTFTVTPANGEFEEQNAARVAEKILQYIRQRENLDLTYTQINSFLTWAGNAFVELCWDSSAGKKMAYCAVCQYASYDPEQIAQPCPTCIAQRQNEQLEQQMRSDQIMKGAVMEAMIQAPPGTMPSDISQGATAQVPPTQLGPLPLGQDIPNLVEAKEGEAKIFLRSVNDVYLPPGITSLRATPWIAIRELADTSYAAFRFPHIAPFIKPDNLLNVSEQSRYRSGGFDGSTVSVELQDHVFIERFYERPTQASPRGQIITKVNDIIAEVKEGWWDELERFPVYHFGFDQVDGELYCTSFLDLAWVRQRELNQLETQMTEHVSQVLKPKLMNPIGSRVTGEEFTSETAQSVSYNPAAGKPEWQQVPMLSPSVWQRKADLVADIRMAASVTESEQGMMGTDPNGRAAAIINAEADQQVGPILLRNNNEWKALHVGILQLYQMFAHPQRIASITGPDGVDTFYFGEAKLTPGWDLVMDVDDGLSRNPQVRLQQAMNLAQVGFFMNEQTGAFDRKAFARYAKLPVPDQGYDHAATEKARASAIPHKIKSGEGFQPRMFDDPMIFAETLLGWLRGPGTKDDPQVTMQVEQIWMYYVQWAVTGQMQAPAGGAGAQPPGARGSQPGSALTAPGGSPKQPPQGNSNVTSQANQQVQQSDKQGEQQARQAESSSQQSLN